MARIGNYYLSRWNRADWMTCHEGIIPCLGERCRSKDSCRLYPSAVTVGGPCMVEARFAVEIEMSLRESWGRLVEAGLLDDYQDLVREAQKTHLGMERARHRRNRSLLMTDERGQLKPEGIREFHLADRYYAGFFRRWQKVLARFWAANHEYVRYLEHERGKTRPIGAPDCTLDREAFLAAIDEAFPPHEPLGMNDYDPTLPGYST